MTLQQAKKFFLIDSSDLKQGNLPIDNNNTIKNNYGNSDNFKERTKPLISKELSQIDKTMATILNNDTLSEEDKVREYNTALSKYQELKSTSYGQTPNSKIPISNSGIENIGKYNPITGIASRYKTKAAELWSLLQQKGDVKVSQNGEVTINNKNIPGSNISDLINLAVNPQLKNNDIVGWNNFKRVLIDSNVPRLLINQKVFTQQYPTYQALPTTKPLTPLDLWLPHDGKEKTIKTKEKKKEGKQKQRSTPY